MGEKKSVDDVGVLRQLAEEQLSIKKATISTAGGDDPLRLLHELQVHQIELEMQNAELRQARDNNEVLMDKYTELYEFAPVGYCTLQPNGKILNLNLSASGQLGVARSQLNGRLFAAYVATADRPVFAKFLDKVFSRQTKQTCELELLKETVAPVYVQLEAIVAESGATCHLAVIDISERKKLESLNKKTTVILKMIASAAAAEDIYNAIALMYEEQHPGLRCSMLTLKGDTLLHGGAPSLPSAYCAAVNGLKYGPRIGSCGAATFTGKRVLVADIASDPNWTTLKDFALPHGLRACWSEPIKDSTGKVLGAFGMYRDYPALPSEDELLGLESAARLTAIIMEREQIKERHQELETQLRQKHKMEAVGVMAGGIAHNFNNNLAVILGNIELARLQSPLNSKISELLANARTASLRSRDLILQILAYSRQGVYSQASIALLSLLNETLKFLSVTTPSTVKLEKHIASGSQDITVIGDSSQLQEVLINLFNNAIQAMGETGTLIVSLDTVELQQQDIPVIYERQPGTYARLSVQDSGCGMLAAVREKIFDPFFTTKGIGKGTGMGLATVQGIVDLHNGLIKVDSAPGQGSTFAVYLPLAETEDVVDLSAISEDMPLGDERILFLDDEEMLVRLGDRMLSELGYQVTTMTSSVEALKLFQANPDQFDLVITDQTMPELSGRELIPELLKIKPDLISILCTGYSSKTSPEDARNLGAKAFMQKPYEQKELAQTVRRVLDGGAE